MIRFAYAWLLLGLLSAASAAHAQSRQATLDASARAFFNQGVTFADEGRTDEAADRFRRAMAIRYSPVIAYNLASMLEARGELVEACELLYRVENDMEADEVLRASAKRLRAQVEPRLAHLMVTVDPSVQEATVLLDDAALIPAQLGAPIPVDPKLHRIDLVANDVVLERREIEFASADEKTVPLGIPKVPTPQQVAAQAPMAPVAEPRVERSGVVYSPWFWAGVGTVVVGAVVVVAVLTLSGGSGGEPVAAP